MEGVNDFSKRRLINLSELMLYTSLKRSKALEIGVESGAKVKLGRRVAYDIRKIDAYIDGLTEVKA